MTTTNINRNEILKFNLGARVGRYEIHSADGHEAGDVIRPIGEGGSGVVFLSKQILHKDISIKRAIKFFLYRKDVAALTEHKLSGPVSLDDYLAEITNISALSHENLVKVIDAGVQSFDGIDVPYIVTDYIQGPT